MNDFTLRRVQENDNAALAKIIREAFTEHHAPTRGTVFEDPATDQLFELFQVPGAVLWVAESNKILLGCGGLFPTEGLPAGCAELVKLYLSATARGKGAGKTLVAKCLESARTMGYTKVYLESLPQFHTAVSMYEKMGFKTLSRPLGNSGHTGCNIWMLKEL